MVNRKDGKEVTAMEQQVALKGKVVDPGKVSFGGHPNILDVHHMDSKGHPRKTMTHLFHLPLAGIERDTHQAFGKMEHNCHPKGSRGLGVKKYISVLYNPCGQMCVEAHLHN